jgi:ABC-type nitrate/sulfonate/bicarbonate transport system substrate-binding protein
VAVAASARFARAQEDLIPLTVELLNRSVNKLPFVIAEDRGLYKKHGLDVKLWMPDQTAEWGTGVPAYEEFISVDIERPEDPDISVDGGTPMMVSILTNAQAYKRILVATTDCVVRWHIFARDGIDSLEDLKGHRLGISGPGAMTGFIARLVAQRMGWDPVHDISIMSNGTSVEALQKGWVDAYVAYEVPYAYALKAGLRPLVDMRPWNEEIAGSSVRVKEEWLQNPRNREATRRFLLATVEAISLFHKDNGKVAMEVMSKWHGIRDSEFARIILNGGKEMPRKPYPCVGGIKKTLELFDSNEARKYKPEDFYDDSLMREIDESGFIDSLYK